MRGRNTLRGVLPFLRQLMRPENKKTKKRNPMRNEIETVEMAPTWEGLLPIYLMSYENGKSSGRAASLAELQRMAKLADLYVASKKGGAK